MKRFAIAAGVVFAFVLSVALPAGAFNSGASTVSGTASGNCAMYMQIDNNGVVGAGGTGDTQMEPFDSTSDDCAFMEAATRIYKCDGTTSTSAYQHVWNPTYLQDLHWHYSFSCPQGQVLGMFVRFASDSGSWTPNSTGGYMWYGWDDVCYPDYCL